jgi:hypothetical protein
MNTGDDMHAITNRTATMLSRMPQWFASQALAAAKSQQDQQASADRRRELEFLCAVEVVESDFGEWLDTLAAFCQR